MRIYRTGLKILLFAYNYVKYYKINNFHLKYSRVQITIAPEALINATKVVETSTYWMAALCQSEKRKDTAKKEFTSVVSRKQLLRHR